MKKIIFSNYDDVLNPDYGGGGALAVHEVAKRLTHKYQYEITVLTGKYHGCKDTDVDGVSYKRIGISWAGPLVGQLTFQFSLPFYAFFLRKYDIWLESFTPPFSTACLQLFTKKPVIGLIHSLSGEDMRKKYFLPFDVFERIGLKTYKRIIILNESMKNKILKTNPDTEIAVIPNGVDEDLISMEVADKEDYILFLGRIDVIQKGLDMLLSVFKAIVSKTDFNLVIAGSGLKKDENSIYKKINEFHLEKRVKLLGRVEGKEKNEILKRASFMVMPSRTENFPIVVLEAFAAKLPIVVFDIPGFAWVQENIIFKAKCFDEKEFANLTLKLAGSKVLREQMGDRARQFVKQFNWDNITEKYKEFI